MLSLCALSLTGCGGGGGSSAPTVSNPTPAPGLTAPPAGNMNLLTSYTVYTGTMDTLGASVQIAAIADGVAPASLQAPTISPGALVFYPDGSVQVADTLGNFDASQSTWAALNMGTLQSDPTLEPEVIVTAQTSGAFLPEDTFVDAYEPGAPMIVGAPGGLESIARYPEGTTPPTLAKLYVAPTSVSLYDAETRTFYATGADASGKRVALGKTPVAWSLTKPAGCAAAAGSITVSKNDSSKVTYKGPASGTATSACPDLVIASVTVGANTLSAQGQAVYRDHKTSVKVSGTLVDLSGKPLGGALLELFGNSPDAAKGKVHTTTSSTGAWSANVDSGRTMAPVAAITVNKKQTYYPVQPASIPVPATGITGLKLTAQVSTVTAKPTPLPKPSPKPTNTPTPKPSPSPTPTATATGSH